MDTQTNKKVIVGMSGGVDSSVAAYLLVQQGYQVEGLFMKNWEGDDHNGYCAAREDLADADSICKQLNIPLHAVNFSQEYWQHVFEHFLEEYEHGRTPNPDVLCNKEIKFKAFLNYALEQGADYIATGHYAKIQCKNGIFELHKAKDRNKDQTYFLNAIPPEALKKVLFPVGTLMKPTIRDIAKEQSFITHDKKDSTGICFIGEKRFKTFLNEYMLAKPGPIKNSLGETLGQHDGLMFYTLGQRQGLGIGGRRDADGGPWYVADKDLATNTLIVVQGQQHPLLYASGLICKNIHWLTEAPPTLPFTCYAKTRYRQHDQACIVSPADNNSHCVMFSNPQRAVTPGQYIVFYQHTQCLGGAVIEEVIR